MLVNELSEESVDGGDRGGHRVVCRWYLARASVAAATMTLRFMGP